MRFLLYAAIAGVILYSLIDAILTRRGTERMLPKWLWILVIVLLPIVGAIGWLIAGRPMREELDAPAAPGAPGAPRLATRGGRRRAPVAPDDDPAFLRQLSDEQWSRRMRELRENGESPVDPHVQHPEPASGAAPGEVRDAASGPVIDPAPGSVGDAAAGTADQ